MKVTITYDDKKALAPEEIIAEAKHLYGDSTIVKVSPSSSDPFNVIYFAFQELVTSRQVESFYDDGALYGAKCEALIKECVAMAESAIIQVIRDNESKLSS